MQGSRLSPKNKEDETCERYIFKDHNHKTVNKLSKLFINKQLCDVTLKIEGKDLEAHKAILAINSDYFEAMFSHWYGESNEHSVKLENLNYHAVCTIVKFMYTGTISLTTENVKDVFIASDLLQMLHIKSLCSGYMVNVLDASNCMGMLSLGEVYNCQYLYDKSMKLLALQFPLVSSTSELYQISFHKLLDILASDDLNLGHEREALVLKVVVKWLDRNGSIDRDDLSLLLTYIRMKHIDKTILQSLLDSSIYFHSQDKKEMVMKQLETCNECEKRNLNQSIYVFGGFLQSRTGPLCPRLKTCEKYNVEKDSWKNIEGLLKTSSNAQIINIKGRILYFEPSSSEGTPQILEYNVVQNTWKTAVLNLSHDVQSLIHNYSRGGELILYDDQNDWLYLVHKSVRKLILEFDEGEICCKQYETLSNTEQLDYEEYSCVVCNNELYLMGGVFKKSLTESEVKADVVCFSRNEWKRKADMLERRGMFGAVYLDRYISQFYIIDGYISQIYIIDGYIYVLGGFNTRRVNTVERYNVHLNQWSYIANLIKERSHLKAVVCSQTIYVMGGKSYSSNHCGARKVLNTCEVYDPVINSWRYIQSMKNSRCVFGAIAF
ncbi:hypothetical protein LOTGIDRAFT_160378 [Lottia gigantea]|uniref:BTB domain-containing protein n=1 Tax=Lottia gigantea TaxID=225164 RepID=V4AQ82_LOTGI|nr:hypothetical protein LOTGIDRAFT_160378 [Lottia gigantea]ESO95821.1 hypothetical protein LOTGIDRAFT_160378 [Lottia gigantea]